MKIDRSIRTVPASHPGELAYHAVVPKRAVEAGVASLVVAVHGISLNALEQVTSFAPFAAERGHVLIAPCFDTPEDADYQRLGRRGRGRRADLALDDAIRRLSESSGIRFVRRFYFGYSGGGQFVHRYLMTHPDRVDGAVVSAAGWYTFPDPRLAYPMGLRVGGALAGARMEPAEFLRVPVLAVVGSLDVERDDSIRTTSKVDERQGDDRRERARRWVAAMRAAARTRNLPARHELVELDGAGHSFLDCVEAGLTKTTFDFFDSIEQAAHDSAAPNLQ
jgi:pimeloyl-ACP methyl ester carboxylesterase